MSRIAHAHQGDTLEAVLYRVYGQTAAVTEQALILNPGLADQGPVLAEGTAIRLPPAPESQETNKPRIQLWT